MTALLQCDGCGAIVGERADESDPTREWWCLTSAPMIGGNLMPMLDLTMSGMEPDDDEPDLPPLDPPRHLCSDECGEAWFRRRREEREARS